MTIDQTAESHPVSRPRRIALAIGSADLPCVVGAGRWALVSKCRYPTSVTLFATYEAAEAARSRLASFRCCPRCSGRHEVVKLPEEGC
jgi:hypothetical protein